MKENYSDSARVMELVDMFDSKSNAAMFVGSSPIPGKLKLLNLVHWTFFYQLIFSSIISTINLNL